MTKLSEVRVTLSAELWKQFHHRSAETGVPLKWLVAGLVCDTLNNADDDDRPANISSRRYRYDDPIKSGVSPSTPWSAESRPRRAIAGPPAVDQ
jgi:hypothetical protein